LRKTYTNPSARRRNGQPLLRRQALICSSEVWT
jgi:hypothetical protein